MSISLFSITIYNVLLWVFVAWHYALFCGFISDDHAVIVKRKDIIPDAEKNPQKEAHWIKVFNDGVIMFYWNKLMYALHLDQCPAVWHAISLAIHLLNTYLLWHVLTPILGSETALIACFLWGINPMLNQNVVWISGRPYLIAVTLTLTAMLWWNNPIIVLPLYALAVITNISIAFLPILLKVMHPDTWQTTFYLAIMFGVGIPFILWKFERRFANALVIDRDNFRFKKRRLHAIAKVYLYYLWTFICPLRMGWYHQAGFRYNPKWEKFNFWTLCGYAFVFFMMKQGVSGWWFLLGILPNANIFATNSFLQDRYLYFGSIGLAILLAPILIQFPELILIIGTFYIVRTYMYSRHMKDDERMYRENWRNHPRSDHAINNLAFFLIRQKRYEEARAIIWRGLNIDRSNKMLWYNLGVTWASTGNLQTEEGKFRFLRAIDCWKKALAIEPRWKKPLDDMTKLTKFLEEQKIITRDPAQSNKAGPTIDIPV